MNEKPKKHWSFIATDIRILLPIVSIIILLGICDAFFHSEPSRLNRVGNFIIGIGVWMSMRGTLREGISRYHNLQDESPVLRGTKQVNLNYFSISNFRRGDAVLQVWGFGIVVVGSILGSYGDFLYLYFYNIQP